MKQSIIPVWGKAFLLALPFMVSCQKDAEQDFTAGRAENETVAEGSFIVDYTSEAESRAEASVRIRSLDYLVYENSGANGAYVMKKHRSIPDINTATVWPLTRNTMTWAQREALKDTLNTSCDYKVVFVANADADVWDEEVLKNVGTENTFEEARLFLPSTKTFDDTNMYYMWTGELSGASYSKNNPASKQILLERMINRVEVKLDESIPYTEDELNTYISAEIDRYYEELISSYPEGKIYTYIRECMESLSEKFGLGAWIIYDDQKNILISDIQQPAFISKFISDLDGLCPGVTTDFKKLLNSSAKLLTYWPSANQVKIVYQENSHADGLDFNKKTVGSQNADSHFYALNNNLFTYYTFGNNDAQSNTLNHVERFEFYKDNNLLFSLSGIAFNFDEIVGGNHLVKIVCNPIGLFEDNAKEEKVISNLNLKSRLEWTDNHFDIGFGKSLSTFEKQLNDNSSYNGTLDNMNLSFNYPMVTFSPIWTLQK